jgi:hypothetical protein
MRGAPDSSEANFIDRQIRQFLAEPSPSARKK